MHPPAKVRAVLGACTPTATDFDFFDSLRANAKHRPLQWSLYSIISNPYSRRGELYKLFRDAGAAAAGGQGEGFAPQI